MLNIFGRWILFLSSYAPLFVILGIKTADESLPAAWALVLTGLAAGALMLVALAWARRIGSIPLDVASSESASGDVVAYLFTYLIPFVGTRTEGLGDLVAVALLIATVGLVFVRSDLLLINPLLAGAGFYLHNVQTTGGTKYVLLTRSESPPTPNSEIRVRRLGNTFGEEAKT
jgi:hypothetical protein